MLDIVLLIAFPAMMAFAAATDLLTMTIPNRLAVALVVAFAIVAGAGGLSLGAIGMHLAMATLVLAVTFGMFSRGWIGGGDAKLAAATTLWFGVEGVADYLLLAGVGGGLLTLVILYYRSHPISPLATRFPWLVRLHDPQCGVPYGIALAASALVVYPYSDVWSVALGG